MDSKHLVDPELTSFLATYQPMDLTPEALPNIRRQRASLILAAIANLPPDQVTKTEHFISSPNQAPAIRVLVYHPQHIQRPAPVYLNIHGGGMILGMPEQDEVANRRIAAQTGCIVVSPAYRLAPETQFPGPLDDCTATLQWIVASAAELGADTERIAIGGTSAGGGLAAALALKTRDQGKIRLAHLLLVFPMLDDRTGSSAAPSPYAGQFIWDAAHNRFAWAAYLGKPAGQASCDPYSVPARAEQLAGLPSTFIACGALDLFIDENIAFARRLIHAGVPTELHVYPGAYHAFQYVPSAQVTKTYQEHMTRSLTKALSR